MRDCSHRQLFRPLWGSSVWRNNQKKLWWKISAHSDLSSNLELSCWCLAELIFTYKDQHCSILLAEFNMSTICKKCFHQSKSLQESLCSEWCHKKTWCTDFTYSLRRLAKVSFIVYCSRYVGRLSFDSQWIKSISCLDKSRASIRFRDTVASHADVLKGSSRRNAWQTP